MLVVKLTMDIDEELAYLLSRGQYGFDLGGWILNSRGVVGPSLGGSRSAPWLYPAQARPGAAPAPPGIDTLGSEANDGRWFGFCAR